MALQPCVVCGKKRNRFSNQICRVCGDPNEVRMYCKGCDTVTVFPVSSIEVLQKAVDDHGVKVTIPNRPGIVLRFSTCICRTPVPFKISAWAFPSTVS